MKITWLGHSAFKLEESTGTTIIADPYSSKVGYEMQVQTCDAVTISHDHDDHNYVGGINGSPEILRGIGSYEIKGVHINSFRSYHDSVKGKKRGSNIIFKYRMDGVDICHLGDIGEECSPFLAEALGAVNILIIPVGGGTTINAEQAKEYVELLMPDIVIPMHFKTHDCDMSLNEVDDFIELFDEEDIVYTRTNSMEFDRTTFDGERTKLLVFEK